MVTQVFRDFFFGGAHALASAPASAPTWNGEERRSSRQRRFNVDRRSVLNSWSHNGPSDRRDSGDRRSGLDRRQ